VAEEIVAAAPESSATERRLLTALVLGSVQTRVLILAEDDLTAHGRGYWVKSDYQRHDDATWWKRARCRRLPHNPPPGSRRSGRAISVERANAARVRG
jgi:hypothetical protein